MGLLGVGIFKIPTVVCRGFLKGRERSAKPAKTAKISFFLANFAPFALKK